MSLRNNHPECKEDELFVTNADDESYKYIGWKTKRKGIISYMISGEPCGEEWPGSFPVFVKKAEIEERNPESIESINNRNKDRKYYVPSMN